MFKPENAWHRAGFVRASAESSAGALIVHVDETRYALPVHIVIDLAMVLRTREKVGLGTVHSNRFLYFSVFLDSPAAGWVQDKTVAWLSVLLFCY